MSDDEKLKHADEILCGLSEVRYNYTWITPTNIEEEFIAFTTRGGAYDPQFKYRDIDVKEHLRQLESLVIPTSTKIGGLFEDIRRHFLIEARALDNIGGDTFDTIPLFGEVSDELLAEAKTILNQPTPDTPEPDKPISSRELGQMLFDAISSYGLEGWTIEYNPDFLANASISSGTRTIRVKDSMFFSEKRAKKLIYHEIGTHVLRAENGFAQEYGILAHGLPHYLPTEEGLAGYNERLQGIESPSILYNYALRTLATRVAATGGFRDVYEAIRPFVDEDRRAFMIAARAKRGLGDTSRPGGYLKDHCYLQGKLLIERFVKEGGDIKKLYAGKIGIEHLWLVDEGHINPPTMLPDFLE
ncbi:MAG: tyrosine/phenylalanine carboxypeptidase domain-containing protein [Nanobdellota archaeon]